MWKSKFSNHHLKLFSFNSRLDSAPSDCKDISQERFWECTGEQSVESFGLQVVKVILEDTKDILQERIPKRSGEQTIDGVVSRVMKEVVEVVPFFLRERIQPAQIQERIVQVGKVIPHERLAERDNFCIAVRIAL